MKNNWILLLIIVASCSQYGDKTDGKDADVVPLIDLVNEGITLESNYQVMGFGNIGLKGKGVVFILPESSCFNCFEEVNIALSHFFEDYPDEKLIVVRNSKIKGREIRFSLQSVLPLEKLTIIDISEIENLTQHDFFPTLAYFNGSGFCCLEVIEQGNKMRLSDYFSFLNFLQK